jgi:hypothetical protein
LIGSLARVLAGIVIDAVEPMANAQGGAVRNKAVNIVADEFLARAAAPRTAGVIYIYLMIAKETYEKT